MSSDDRNANIDFLKGILILLVILGHILPGSIRHNLPRYAIYSFHMPLFIGICGYLLRPSSLGELSFLSLVKKYFFRAILPWIIAFHLFYGLRFFNNPINFTTENYLESLRYFTPAHLWFIPGFLTYIFLTWLMIKFIKKPWPLLLIISAIISLGFCIYDNYPFTDEALINTEETLYHNFHMLYYVYFVFGMYLREKISKIPKTSSVNPGIWACLFSAVLLFGFYIFLFGHPNCFLENAVKYIMNFLLMIWMFFAARTRSFPRCRLLEYLGINSLAYYLYVQAAETWLYHYMIPDTRPVIYWPTISILTILLMCALPTLNRMPFIRKYMFGIVKRPGA